MSALARSAPRMWMLALGIGVSMLIGCATAGERQSPRSSSAVWLTLGTGGGPATRLDRSQPANALLVDDRIYVFDAGDGTQRQMLAAGLDSTRVVAIFLSHHHIDHTAGVAPIVLSRWLQRVPQPIELLGPPGIVAMAQSLASAHHGAELAPIAIGGPEPPPIASVVRATDLPALTPDPAVVFDDGVIRVFAMTNDHYHYPPGSAAAQSRSYAFRIEARGRVIVYTGDTGPSENVARLARNADLLVSEVIDLEATRAALAARQFPEAALGPLLGHLRQDHLSPGDIGSLAARADVGEVLLTHLTPGLDGEASLTGYTRGVAEFYRGRVRVAQDLGRY